MNKKKLLTLAMVLSMVAILAIGGTIAYFTDTDEATNVFVSGNVSIIQNETDRNGYDYDYSEPKLLMPIVFDKKVDGYHMGQNYIDKFVTVTNDGDQPAYVRTYFAFPAALDDGDPTYDAMQNFLHWNGASASDKDGAMQDQGTIDNAWYWTAPEKAQAGIDWPTKEEPTIWQAFQTEVNGVLCNVYVATHKEILEVGETTAPSLMGVYLDKLVDYVDASDMFDDPETEEKELYTGYIGWDYREEKYVKIDFDLSENFNIEVATEAVQAQGFENAWVALDEAFGKPSATNHPWYEVVE